MTYARNSKKRSYRPIKSVPGQFRDLVEKHFQIGARGTSEYMVRCTFHDNDGSCTLQINIDTGMFICFSESCGAKGGPQALNKYTGTKFNDSEVDVTDVLNRLDQLSNQSGRAFTQTALSEETLDKFKWDTDYWTNRGFSEVTQNAFDLGFDLLNDTVTIALRDIHSRLIGFIKRELDDDADLRYRYPKGFKKSHELFASWLAAKAQTDELVIVEGSTDCMAVWQAGFACVGQYGSAISLEQIAMIRRMGFHKLVLFYDDDKAGRSATDRALGKIRHMKNKQVVHEYDPDYDLCRDFSVRVVSYEDGMANDPGGMDSLSITKAIIDAQSPVV